MLATLARQETQILMELAAILSGGIKIKITKEVERLEAVAEVGETVTIAQYAKYVEKLVIQQHIAISDTIRVIWALHQLLQTMLTQMQHT